MNPNVPNSSTDLSQRFALDVQGFDGLRAQAAASPQEGLKTVAKQFDAVFLNMMLKSMREATPQEGLLDSHDGATYTAMLDQQLAQQLSSKGLGVADALTKQLSRNAGIGQGGALHSGGAGSAAAALTALGSIDSAGASIGGMGAAGMGAAGVGAEGNAAMMKALARAYAKASADGALSKGAEGYSAASALTPPLRGNGSSSKVDAFVEKMAAPAQAASEATGIPARFIVGQAALESGWGKGEIRHPNGAPSHNVFGIKAGKDWTGKTVSTVTTEYVNGTPHKVVEKFRAYGSYQDAMTDYANLLRGNPRYASVVNSSRDAASFAHGMQQAGYATDPHYAKKLISIMRQMG